MSELDGLNFTLVGIFDSLNILWVGLNISRKGILDDLNIIRIVFDSFVAQDLVVNLEELSSQLFIFLFRIVMPLLICLFSAQ